MNAFMIDLDNRPGALADITELLAAGGVNITAVTAAACGDSGRLAFTADDESAVRTVLGNAGRAYTEIGITEVHMRHQPGALAAIARKLATSGINIEAVMPMGMDGDDVIVALVTDDPVTAEELLVEAGTAS